jgi:Protein of unknown function (DUF1360)
VTGAEDTFKWSEESDEYEPEYERPTLRHFIECPFCQGFWVCCAVYVLWVLVPTETLYVAFPFALSGAVGLIAKNLDS